VALVEGLGARAVDLDLFDAGAVSRAVVGHEVVCNLATHIPRTSKMALPRAWAENDRLRTEAARNLAGAALEAGADRYVQESIAFLYADGGDDWLDEGSPIDAVANLATALEAEASAARVTAGGAQGVVLRFATFYGPGSHTTRDTVSLVRRRLAAGFGAERYISSLHTDDAAGAVVAALGAPAGTYNVGDDEPLTRREYFDSLARALGVGLPRIAPAGGARLAGKRAAVLARSQRVSNRRFTEASGWSPRFRSAREGWPEVLARL
jgi:nucleoside-diphosphate-sugar epimerase